MTRPSRFCAYIQVVLRLRAFPNRAGGSERKVRAGRSGLTIFIVLAGCLTLPAAASAAMYWTEPQTNAIARASLSGHDIHQRFIEGLSDPSGVCVAGGYIYWTEFHGGSIGRARLTGTDVERHFITGLSHPDGIAVVGGSIYWTEPFNGTIGRANLNGQHVDHRLISDSDVSYDIAVSGAYIYWSADTTPGHNFGRDTGVIARADLNGSHVEQSFVGELNSPGPLAVNSEWIYWGSDPGNGKGFIGRAKLDGQQISRHFLAPRHAFPEGLTLNARYLFWTNGGLRPFSIGRATLAGKHIHNNFVNLSSTPDGIAL